MSTIDAVDLAERRLAPLERINRRDVRLLASFEFFPPRSPEAAARLEEASRRLRPLEPRFVSVTYGAGGTTRAETFDATQTLRAAGYQVAAHVTCVAHDRGELRELAHRYAEAGVHHLVALRGDLPPDHVRPADSPAHASDLVALLREEGVREISVAAFPEGHPESAFDVRREVENLKRKEAAGATQALTQFTFDNELLLRFIDLARAAGVTIPIVPGILPVTDVAQTRRFAATVGATVPRWIDRLLDGLDDDPATRDLVAAAIVAEQCADLATHGVRHVHFYTLNRPALTYAVCRLIGVRTPWSPAPVEPAT